MADLQASTARLGAEWELEKLIDISDEQAKQDLRRLSATMISIVAQSARLHDGHTTPVDAATVASGETAAERFLLEWRGEADPKHVTAIDTYWICTAEHGMNASTFTARVVASTGADCAAVLSVGCRRALGTRSTAVRPARVLPMLDAAADAVERRRATSRDCSTAGERLMGFGHRVYRAEDPRARVLRRTAKELGSPRFEVAEELEQCGPRRARRAPSRARPRDERRVLVGRRARRRRDSAAA